MDQAWILEVTGKALILVLTLSMPPIIAATVVGLLIALMQALTQVQEQTLGFAVKLVVVTVVLLFMAGWAGSELLKFTIQMFEVFPTLRR